MLAVSTLMLEIVAAMKVRVFPWKQSYYREQLVTDVIVSHLRDDLPPGQRLQ